MTDVNELKRLVKALQSAGNDKETIDVLNTLKSEAKINESLLRESKLGLAVGKLRTNENKDISDLAKELVKKWRAQVDKEKAAAGKGKSDLSKGKPEPTRKDSLTPTTPTISQRGGPAMSAASARTAKSDGVNTGLTGDKTRDKCIELIYDGLAMDSGFPSDLLLTRAKAVEDAVRSDCGGTTAAYKSKIRSLYVNLKEKHNAELRDSIASGDIAARDFAKMSSADMASEERKAANKKIEEEMFFKTLGAGEQQAETDAFQCGRCKQRKCRYRQAQTRSADEPMTTFVTCTNCNHRWKFS